MVRDFINGDGAVDELNDTFFFYHILKLKSSRHIFEYHSISLCNVSYKIIS